MIATNIDSYHTRNAAARAAASQTLARRGQALQVGTWVIALAAVVATLIPRWPLSTFPVNVPTYFTSTAVDRIPRGSVVLMSPFPSVAEVLPEVFQAASGMRFSLIGGYAFFVDAHGNSTAYSAPLYPEDVETYMWANATGGGGYPLSATPRLNQKLVDDTRTFLRRYRVGSVIATTVGANPEGSYLLFSRVLGPPTEVTGTWGAVGAVAVWYGVPKLIKHSNLKTVG
jgi:hypothetical protein